MTKILTEKEIEALRQSLSESSLLKEDNQNNRHIETYDFIAQKHLPPRLLTVLTMIFHRFTLNFRGSLSLKLRKVVRMELLEKTTFTFNELIESLSNICWINILNIKSLGQCLFILEADLALSLVDLLCGGPGKKIKRKNFTSFALLEQSLIKKVVELAIGDLKEAFNSVISTDIEIQGVEFNPQLLTIFSPDEFIVVIPIKVSIEDMSANMVFALPHNSLRPLKEILEINQRRGSGNTWADRIIDDLLEVEVEVIIDLGYKSISVDELLALKEGDILDLNKDISEKIIFKVEGIPFFEGYPVEIKGNKGIKISNLIGGEEDESDEGKGEDKGHTEKRGRAGGGVS